MDKNTMIYLCGCHSVLLALFHAGFWKLFRWPSTLKGMGEVNQAIMQILNIRLIYIFLLTAFLCFFYAEDLYSTRVGKAFLVGMAIFWAGRTLEQFIFVRISHWLVHVLTVVFIFGIVIFFLPAIS